MASIPPRSSGAIPPIRIPHAFLPPPSFRRAFCFFLSLSSFSLYPCLFPFLAPSSVESGHVDTTPENLANLYVRTCILMCMFMSKTVVEHYLKWIYCQYFCFISSTQGRSQVQLQVPITRDQVQPKYWSMNIEW